jgi:integrase
MGKITDREIKGGISKLRAGETGRIELREGLERGAGRLCIIMRKTANDVIAEWYVQWHREGERKTTKIGGYPRMSLAEARRTFLEDYVPDLLSGKNPQGPRAWTKRRSPTVEALFQAYLDHLQAKGSSAGSIRAARYCLLGPSGAVHALGASRPAASVRTDEMIRLLAAIRARGKAHHANNVRAFMRAAFEFGLKSVNSYHETTSGMDWGLMMNPAAVIATDPAAFVPGERHLSEDEIRAFWDWLTVKGKSFRYRLAPAMQLLIATGQRPSEILRLGGASFDPAAGVISWPKTKNRRPHCIPLPRQARAILEWLEPNETGLYFAAQKTRSKPAASCCFEPIVERYLAETGAAKFVTRDLRRTWKTMAGAAGLSKEIRDRLQNHALTDVSAKHYDRHTYLDEKRAAMQQWEDYLAKILTGDADGVVDFARPVRVTKDPWVLLSPQLDNAA